MQIYAESTSPYLVIVRNDRRDLVTRKTQVLLWNAVLSPGAGVECCVLGLSARETPLPRTQSVAWCSSKHTFIF